MLATIAAAVTFSLVFGFSPSAQSSPPAAPLQETPTSGVTGDTRPDLGPGGVGSRQVVLRGTVLTPEGLPASRVLVTAMPGGGTRTGSQGNFELVVQVSSSVGSLELSLWNPGLHAGTTTRDVVLPPRSGVLDLGLLYLESATPFQPRWVPTFGPEPGVNSSVQRFVTFDDGSGPALYAGGWFRTAGGQPANGVAKWDGEAWSPLGDGPGNVGTLAVYDDGTGPALYAGLYIRSGMVPEHFVMKWDGSTWQPLPSDLDGSVEDLVAYDDGNGACLYAAGRFLNAGGEPIRWLAKWDGTSWSRVGGEEPDSVARVLAVVDDGSGSALYVGGFFENIGALEVNHIARWDGSWSNMRTGRNNTVSAITGYNNGSGTRVYIGGSFTGRVARWSGGNWSTVGGGFSSDVTTLEGYDDGNGPALYASGLFTSNPRGLARWRGAGGWTQVGAGINSFAIDMTVFDDGTGPELVLGGLFSVAGDRSVSRVARWDGDRFAPMNVDSTGLSSSVRALATFDDGQGSDLYVAGYHNLFAETPLLDGLARWDGTEWSRVGQDVGGVTLALLPHDDGNGEALFVGGSLFADIGDPIGNVAAWDGSAWSLLDGSVDFIVQTLALFDAGSGPELYAAGGFLGNNAHISRWNGTSWSTVASFNDECHKLLAFDAGSGSELYAAGSFTAVSGMPANRIARWNGAGWSTLGTGLDGRVDALAIFDAGAGPRLLVGGSFASAGGVPAAGLASWDGLSWAPVSSGVDGFVTSLTSFEDGRGSALYVGGVFASIGGVAAQGIARWDGTTFEPLGRGVFQPEGFEISTGVYALLGVTERGRSELYVGGGFSSVPDSGDSYLARWGGTTVCLNFETEDDFRTPLVNGQALSIGDEFGRVLTISGAGPNAGAAIFDSTPGGPNQTSQDPDLLAGSGQVLILQSDDATSQGVPGVFDRPNDDEDGGILTFGFVEPVQLRDVALLDIDSGNEEATFVVQIDGAGRQRVHTVPPGWTGDLLEGAPGRLLLELSHTDPQPGHASTATATEDPGFDGRNVVTLEVWFGSSGAVDDLCWESVGP